MQALITDRVVAFRFSIEIGEELQREVFEWRKLGKKEISSTQSGGFKLVRLPLESKDGKRLDVMVSGAGSQGIVISTTNK